MELTNVLTYERSVSLLSLSAFENLAFDFDFDLGIDFDLISAILIDCLENFQAKIVAEAANGPITASAETILEGNKIVILPDLLLNAVSSKDYFFFRL